ncbi:hypothetical protein J6590_094010, partial [Homalodisca vitripennis]
MRNRILSVDMNNWLGCLLARTERRHRPLVVCTPNSAAYTQLIHWDLENNRVRNGSPGILQTVSQIRLTPLKRDLSIHSSKYTF